MVENTKIEWATHINRNATGRTLGSYKSAAKKCGCSLTEWIDKRIAGLKWCYQCREWKKFDLFCLDPTRGGGQSSRCKNCVSVSCRIFKYSLSPEDLYRLSEQQGHACLICIKVKPLVIDHDHTTGKVRGLLCNRCNIALGFIEDAGLVSAARAYLENRCG